MMILQNRHVRGPVCGRANQPNEEIACPLPEHMDPTLLERKGRLYLLCRPEIDAAIPAEVFRRYYTDTSFDTLPSLRSVLSAAYADCPEARDHLPLAMVIQEREMSALGTKEAVIWGVRFDQIRELLAPYRQEQPWPMRSTQESAQSEATLYSVQWRLVTGDSLVLSTRRAAQRLSADKLRRILRAKATAAAAARALARLATGRQRARRIPVTVLHLPGFSPVPELGPAKKVAAPQPMSAKMRPREGRSPIWLALFMAIVAVGLSLWIKRPNLSRSSVSDFLVWMLTPEPAATVAISSPEPPPESKPTRVRPTPSPEPLPTTQTQARRQPTISQPRTQPAPLATPTPATPDYPIPRLLNPKRDEYLHGPSLTFRWVWEGELAEDEYFDVRVWRVGAPKQGIAWTKALEYVERSPRYGWNSWTVCVIRGKDGVIEEELSDEPEAVNFRWQPSEGQSEKPTKEPTEEPTVVPTRATPENRPTRVTPSPDEE